MPIPHTTRCNTEALAKIATRKFSASAIPPIMPRPWKVTVLISGSGSNLQALIDSLDSSISITHVISSKPSAYGLERAKKAGIPTSIFSLKEFRRSHPEKTRVDYDIELAKIIKSGEPDLVVLAGWMLILSEGFLSELVRSWPEGPDSPYVTAPAAGADIPIINLHPALPGTFPGAHAIDDAFAAFQRGDISHTGIMIHRVIKELDAGAPIVTRTVAIEPSDSIADLEERIHGVEHEAIVEAVNTVVKTLLPGGEWWTPKTA